MTQKMSFSALEREYKAVFRDKIDKSDDSQDVEKQFTHIVGQFLQQVLGEGVEVLDNDIVYDPESPFFYSLGGKLQDNKRFKELYNNSDLPSILKRFAENAYKAIKHYRNMDVQDEIKLRGASGSRYPRGGHRIAVNPGSSKRR